MWYEPTEHKRKNLPHNKYQPNNQCKLLLSHPKQDSVNAEVEGNHEEIRKELVIFIKVYLNYRNIKTLESNRRQIIKGSHVKGQLILGSQTQTMPSLDLTHIFPSLCQCDEYYQVFTHISRATDQEHLGLLHNLPGWAFPCVPHPQQTVVQAAQGLSPSLGQSDFSNTGWFLATCCKQISTSKVVTESHSKRQVHKQKKNFTGQLPLSLLCNYSPLRRKR